MSLRWYYPDQVMTVYSQIETSRRSLPSMLMRLLTGENDN
jgi:hypothetical protein